MSKYTTEVRFICETEAGLTESEGYKSVNNILAISAPKVFDFDYPIFDEAYRLTLETKILKHYYTREICAETVGLWKLWLDAKMNEIMPYYNELYKTALYKFNPLYDADYYREHEGQGTKHDETENKLGSTRTGGWSDTTVESGSTETIEKYSDTPQNGLNDVLQDKYLTNVRVTEQTPKQRTTTGTRVFNSDRTVNDGKIIGDGNTTDQYIEHVYGKTPGRSYASLVKEFRDTLLNIDMMVINNLRELFFNLW